MNNAEYADWLECQLCGYYDRETDLPTTDEGDYEPEPITDSCDCCGETVTLEFDGNVEFFHCRHCGYLNQEVE